MLSRNRMVIECAFGHLSQRYNIFNGLKTKRGTSELVIATACHLHNYLKMRNPEPVQPKRKW